jgi:predicted Zn-dependent protease with MMP-like domain
MQRQTPHHPRIPLRDRIDPAMVDVSLHILGVCATTFAITARMPLALALAAIVWGTSWYLCYEEESARSLAQDAPVAVSHSEVELQQVGSLSDAQFDALQDEVERQAQLPACDLRIPERLAALDDAEFEELVRDAVNDLPDFVLRELEAENIAVTVSDAGHKFGAYGLYVGGSLAYDDWASQILIFRDTLTRDFGADRDELRAQVIRVVRHEVAHHLGAGERQVRDLGL